MGGLVGIRQLDLIRVTEAGSWSQADAVKLRSKNRHLQYDFNRADKCHLGMASALMSACGQGLMQVAAAARLGSLMHVKSSTFFLQQDADRQDSARHCDNAYVLVIPLMLGPTLLMLLCLFCVCFAGQDHEGVGPHRTQRPTHTSARCGQGEPRPGCLSNTRHFSCGISLLSVKCVRGRVGWAGAWCVTLD
jgi:hypothetical protein